MSDKFDDDLNEVDNSGIPILEDMASYREEDTGLPFIVVILSRSGAKHGPRVKFQQNYSSNLTTTSKSRRMEALVT